MAYNEKFILHSVGYAFLDSNDCFEVLDCAIELELKGIEAQLNQGVYIIPTEQQFRARISAGALNANILSLLTGGTITANASANRQHETLTKSTTTITLSQTPLDTKFIRIIPSGSSKEPLVQVSAAPAVGQYSISGTTVTINGSQTESTFVCTYFYADASYGETLTIDPDDLPTSFEFLGAWPMKDLFPDYDGYAIVNFAKCDRIPGVVEFGTGKNETRTLDFSVNVRNDTTGDVKIYFSKTA